MRVEGDTLGTVVRNLSSGELTMDQGDGYCGASFLLGDVERFEPATSELAFSLGSGADRVRVRITLALLRFPDRGTVRVTAQAILNEAPKP